MPAATREAATAGPAAQRWAGAWNEEGFMPQHKRWRWATGRAAALTGCASLLGGLVLAAPAASGTE